MVGGADSCLQACVCILCWISSAFALFCGNQENGEGQALDEAMNGEETHDSKKAKITVIPNEPLVPCFELPEELQEYRGDPDDRKAMMLWRQKLQVWR